MTLIKSWQQHTGRALVQARPVGALLGVLPVAYLGGIFIARGGWFVVAAVPLALTGVHCLRELARLTLHEATRAAGNALIVIAVVCLWAVALGPRLFGYQTMTVLSTSMEPTFNPGDVIFVTRQPAASVRAGEIISFHVPSGDHHVVTHRIATVVMRGGHPVVQTKGDANTVADPWRARLDGASVWRYQGRVPLVGYPLLYLRQPPVRMATLYGAPALLVLLLLGRIWLPADSLTRIRRRLSHA